MTSGEKTPDAVKAMPKIVPAATRLIVEVAIMCVMCVLSIGISSSGLLFEILRFGPRTMNRFCVGEKILEMMATFS